MVWRVSLGPARAGGAVPELLWMSAVLPSGKGAQRICGLSPRPCSMEPGWVVPGAGGHHTRGEERGGAFLHGDAHSAQEQRPGLVHSGRGSSGSGSEMQRQLLAQLWIIFVVE